MFSWCETCAYKPAFHQWLTALRPKAKDEANTLSPSGRALQMAPAMARNTKSIKHRGTADPMVKLLDAMQCGLGWAEGNGPHEASAL